MGTKALFCANFGTRVGAKMPCNSVWCGKCYQAYPDDKFHINLPQDASCFVQVQKGDEFRFVRARDGDQFLCPFQCDNCVFYILKHRTPDHSNPTDSLLMRCIRRVNLDAFWAREPDTVSDNRRDLEAGIKIANTLRIDPPFWPMGPFPTIDICGYGVAISMVYKSLSPGRHDKSYTQFETIRKLRPAFSNSYMASALGHNQANSIGRTIGHVYLTKCPTQSLWFGRFTEGCLKRMGQVIKRDLGISIEVLHEMLRLLKEDLKSTQGLEKYMLIMTVAFSCICFCGSFRGHEVFLVGLAGLIQYNARLKSTGKTQYVMIPLLGRFKGETGEKYHLTPLAAETKSGIKEHFWIQLLMSIHHLFHRVSGPAFCDRTGTKLTSKDIQEYVLKYLARIQDTRPDLIGPDVNVQEEYCISRSFRRGATTHAKNQKVSKMDINAANRWRNVENTQGRKISQPMRDHYSEVSQMIPNLLRFSQALQFAYHISNSYGMGNNNQKCFRRKRWGYKVNYSFNPQVVSVFL